MSVYSVYHSSLNTHPYTANSDSGSTENGFGHLLVKNLPHKMCRFWYTCTKLLQYLQQAGATSIIVPELSLLIRNFHNVYSRNKYSNSMYNSYRDGDNNGASDNINLRCPRLLLRYDFRAFKTSACVTVIEII